MMRCIIVSEESTPYTATNTKYANEPVAVINDANSHNAMAAAVIEPTSPAKHSGCVRMLKKQNTMHAANVQIIRGWMAMPSV